MQTSRLTTAPMPELDEAERAVAPRSPGRLRFEPELETRYQLHMRANQRASTLVCLLAALAIWLVFIGLDLVRLGGLDGLSGDLDIAIAIALRLATVLALLAPLVLSVFQPVPGAYHRFSMLVLVLIGTTCAYIANVYKLRGLPHVDIAQIVIIAAVFLPVGLTVRQSVAIALFIAVFTTGLGFGMLEPRQLMEHGRLSVLLYFAVFVSAVGAWLRERAQRDEYLLRLELRNQSMSDSLTGIANRRGFEEHLARALHQAQRDSVSAVFAMLDVDHFKAYNDHYGHQAGDTTLKLIASTIDAAARRPMDMVGRLGGEEFGVLLYDAVPEYALDRLQQLVSEVAKLGIEHAASPTSELVTISLGSVAFDGRETSAELFRRADAALYAAKTAGRNRIEFSPTGRIHEFPAAARRRS